jgi:hypothetical protein
MPAQNGVRCDDRRDVREHSTAEALTKCRKPPPFVVRQSEPSAAQLRLENPVLFLTKRDHIPLLSVKPAQQSRDK